MSHFLFKQFLICENLLYCMIPKIYFVYISLFVLLCVYVHFMLYNRIEGVRKNANLVYCDCCFKENIFKVTNMLHSNSLALTYSAL